MCHEEHDDGTDTQNRLHDVLDGGVMVHAAKSIGHRTGHNGNDGVQDEQYHRKHGVQHRLTVLLVGIGAHE